MELIRKTLRSFAGLKIGVICAAFLLLVTLLIMSGCSLPHRDTASSGRNPGVQDADAGGSQGDAPGGIEDLDEPSAPDSESGQGESIAED